MLTVQYPEAQVKTLDDLRAIPLRGAERPEPTRLDMISNVTRIKSPTEVDHYQLRRTIDIYVRPLNEDLGRIANAIDGIIAQTKIPDGPDRDAARHGAGHARLVQQLRARAVPGGGAAVPDSGGAVPVVHRSVHHPAGGAARADRRDPDALADRHHAERDVADGRGDAGGHRGVEQHSDRGVHAPSARAKAWRSAKRSPWPAASGCGRC